MYYPLFALSKSAYSDAGHFWGNHITEGQPVPDQREWNKQDAARILTNISMLTLFGTAAGRAMLGFKQQVGAQPSDVSSTVSPSTLEIPLPMGDDDTTDKKKRGLAKFSAQLSKVSQNLLVGGEVDRINPATLPAKELKKGIAHEHEHTKSTAIAKEIASDHIVEHANYYDKLPQFERTLSTKAADHQTLDTMPTDRTPAEAAAVGNRTEMIDGTMYPKLAPYRNWSEALGDRLAGLFRSPVNSPDTAGTAAKGDAAQSVAGVPLLWGTIPAALGAGYLGWAGMDKLLGGWRKKQTDDKLQATKAEFMQLLGNMHKQSEDNDPVGQLADLVLRKSAEDPAPTLGTPDPSPTPHPSPTPGMWNSIKGIGAPGLAMVGAYMLAMGGLSGKLSYDYFSKRDEQKITEDAMRRRASQRAGGFLPQHVYLEDKSSYA